MMKDPPHFPPPNPPTPPPLPPALPGLLHGGFMSLRVQQWVKGGSQGFDPQLGTTVWAALQGTGMRPSHLDTPPATLLAEKANLVSVEASVWG